MAVVAVSRYGRYDRGHHRMYTRIYAFVPSACCDGTPRALQIQFSPEKSNRGPTVGRKRSPPEVQAVEGHHTSFLSRRTFPVTPVISASRSRARAA